MVGLEVRLVNSDESASSGARKKTATTAAEANAVKMARLWLNQEVREAPIRP